jgi:hypothetical protein
LVLPTFPHCAFRHGEALDMGLMGDYIWLWNVLEWPSGSITVTSVNEDEQSFKDHHDDGWTRFIDQSSKNSFGMPISV